MSRFERVLRIGGCLCSPLFAGAAFISRRARGAGSGAVSYSVRRKFLRSGLKASMKAEHQFSRV